MRVTQTPLSLFPIIINSDMSLSELIQKDREMIEGNESSEEN